MVLVCFRGAENHDVAVSHRFQEKGRLKNRSHQTFLDEWGSQGFLGGSGALRGHRTFEKAFLGGPTSWTTTAEKVLYSDKSRNCGKGTRKGKGKGQGKGVDALLEGTLKILCICMAVSCLFPGQGDQGNFPQAELRPGKLPTSRTATWSSPQAELLPGSSPACSELAELGELAGGGGGWRAWLGAGRSAHG